ncbi:hypothetical protein DSECCO2_603200 [anaerobic digester metagenome]
MLLLTTTKASRISTETLRASSAVNTRYIIAIIFCRGVSLYPAIVNLYNNVFENQLIWLNLSYIHSSKHVAINIIERSHFFGKRIQFLAVAVQVFT